MKICIADLLIDWGFEDGGFTEKFAVTNNNTDPVIRFTHKNNMSECHGIQYVNTPSDHILRRCGSSVELLCSNKDWSKAVLYAKDYADKDYSLPLAAICSRFAFFNTIFLHGSFVEYQGDGVVFTGFSGVGKTTQARLWSEFLGALPINGDKVFLRVIDGKVNAYGSPWKGSSEYCINKRANLKGIVVLKQAKENTIRRLSTIDCIELFMPHIFLPHWDEDNLLKALDTFNDIIEKIPVWLLECRPDEAAVKLTRETIFNIKNEPIAE